MILSYLVINQINFIMTNSKKVYFFIALSFCFSLNAQNNKGAAAGAAAGAAVGGALAIGAAAFAIHQIIEMWELGATEYVLDNRPDATEFTLKLNKPFSGTTKWSDVSNLSLLSFNINYSVINSEENSKREVLLMFMDDGYMTEYGIDVTKVTWSIMNKSEWNGILAVYLNLATGLDVISNGRAFIYEEIEAGNLDVSDTGIVSVVGRDFSTTFYKKSSVSISLSRGISFGSSSLGDFEGGTRIANFKKINGDGYIVSDYSEEFKIVYNEKSLGIYLKEDKRLVQLNRSVLNGITSFINH